MIKKYLTKPEEILALKDTDTKIYCKDITEWYCQFIDGVLCRIFREKTPLFNASMEVNGNYYILVEEPVKEADENDIGKLCLFWDDNYKGRAISVLESMQRGNFKYKAKYGASWQHCRRLTPAEVAEITGYKVEE